MSRGIESIYQLIRQFVTCENRLEPYKLSQKQVADVFVWLDQRRRSFVDVSDFFTRFPELSQQELFYVFKFLDVSRKGAFTHEDLQKAICIKSSINLNTQDDSIRAITNIVKILKATFHLVQDKKKKMHLTRSTLEQIFSKATLNKKDRIQLKDLIILFKEKQLKVDEQMIIYLQNQIFKRSSLSCQQFLQIFIEFRWEQPSTNYLKQKYQVQQEVKLPNSYLKIKTGQKYNIVDKTSSQIDRILQKYKTPLAQNILISSKKQQFLKKMQFQASKMGNKELYQKILHQPKPQQQQFKSKLGQHNTLIGTYEDKKIEDLIKSSSPTYQSNCQINRRRQQLRRGSLQRQKIIQQVVNRKKKIEINDYAVSKPGTLYNTNMKLQIKDPEADFRNYQPVRVLSPTYQSLMNYNQKQTINTAPYGKLYQTSTIDKQLQFIRPASASKTSNNFFEKSSSFSKLQSYQNSLKPDLSQFYRKGAQTPKSHAYDKQNILRRAQEEATKKIQQIQRRARLKVMQKRSATGVYNRWLK